MYGILRYTSLTWASRREDDQNSRVCTGALDSANAARLTYGHTRHDYESRGSITYSSLAAFLFRRSGLPLHLWQGPCWRWGLVLDGLAHSLGGRRL
jgi:hypothetical protein